MKKTYIKSKYEELVKQIRGINAKYLHVISFDLIFIVLSFVGFVIWNKILSSQPQLSSLDNIQALTSSSAVEGIGKLTFIIVSSSILLVLFILILSSVTRGYMWSTIFGKKTSKEFLKRFTLLNMVYLIPYTILVMLSIGILYMLTTGFISLVSRITANTAINSVIAFIFSVLFIGPFFLYFLNLSGMINIYFLKTDKIFSSIGKAFSFIINKGHELYVPYVLVTILFFIVSAILMVFRVWPALYNYVAVIFMLAYMTFIRFYLKELVD